MVTRKALLQKTQQVGMYTLLSRCFGLVREFLMVRYMGADALADAFFTAWKIPNLLRKLFAEGALSAAFVPAVMQTVRNEGKQALGGLMFLGFILFEGAVLGLCALLMCSATWVITFIAPGFAPDQVIACAHYLRILMPFIFLISTSALLAGPLQAVGHFFIPAFGPVLVNILWIAGVLLCLYRNLPISVLCWFIIIGGVLQLIAHIIAYFHAQFSVRWWTHADMKKFGLIILRFIPCFLSTSMLEASFLIDTSLATYLSKGSVALMSYANRFMGIPLGVFAVALSTTLLPHFSRISLYAPRRLGFYLLEATKLVCWVTIPMTVGMMFFSSQFFITLFVSDKFSSAQATEAARILIAAVAGLFFFSINKILLNVYYALHETIIPACIAMLAVLLNVVFDLLLIGPYQAVGLTAATTIAAMVQTLFLYGFLSYAYRLPLYGAHLALFIGRYCLQLSIIGIGFLAIFKSLFYFFTYYHAFFFTQQLGFWAWVVPLSVLFLMVLYYTRTWFGVRIVFLER
jgi:putative peptidoglycan lipid II flippase